MMWEDDCAVAVHCTWASNGPNQSQEASHPRIENLAGDSHSKDCIENATLVTDWMLRQNPSKSVLPRRS
jgi:hypothetical protein